MKRRKEFHLFSLGILLFTLTLTIVSGRIAIHAADLNTELPANDSTEISSEIPTETPVVPSTENPKPVLQGLIHDKNGKTGGKRLAKTNTISGKTDRQLPGKRIFPITYVTLIKKGF